MRVFLDSNVFISGLYSPKGAPGIILRNFIEGCFIIVISQQVLVEVVRTVKEKLPSALPALNTLLINAPPEIVQDPPPDAVRLWTGELHVEDAAILASAIAARADYFVTGDNHFLENQVVMETSGQNVLAPSEFLRLLSGSS